MQRKYNKQLVPFAKQLRKEMTKEERHLWYDFLRAYPIRFTRQKVMGKYILDFYCAEAKLAIELDGSQHYDAAAQEYDVRRTEYFEALGLTVVRYSNTDINVRFAEVCDSIDYLIQQRLGK